LVIDLNKLNNNFVSDYSGKYVISFRRYFRITLWVYGPHNLLINAEYIWYNFINIHKSYEIV